MIDATNLPDIVEAFAQGYLLVDTEGRVVTLGSRALEILGVTDQEAAGKHISEVVRLGGVENAIFEGPESVLERSLSTGAEFNSPISGLRVETPTGQGLSISRSGR